jgi:hypothetical protein
MNDNFLPKELVQKSFALVKSSHERLGFGELPKLVATGENMVPLSLIPDGLALMASVKAAFRFRILCWLGGLAIVAAGLFLSRWILVGLVLVLIADRKLASSERAQWMLLAAFKLAMEMLANDFAGWGEAHSQERERSLELLGGEGRTTLLDFYLPRRGELAASLLQTFGPGLVVPVSK